MFSSKVRKVSFIKKGLKPTFQIYQPAKIQISEAQKEKRIPNEFQKGSRVEPTG